MINFRNGLWRIGISGIGLPFSKQHFPEEFKNKSRLYYYSTIFNSIEINSSFYKIPRPQTLLKWSDETTEGFCFTLKLFKEITHCKQLCYEEENIRQFLEAVSVVKEKGCLLLQFPGKITFDYFSELEQILTSLAILDPGNTWRMALEFRHASWLSGETKELLKEYNATMVLQDHSKNREMNPEPGAGFYYFRFHGPKGDYRGSYDEAFLREKATNIRQLLSNGKDVYAYFNNTMGNAYENARMLDQFVIE